MTLEFAGASASNRKNSLLKTGNFSVFKLFIKIETHLFSSKKYRAKTTNFSFLNIYKIETAAILIQENSELKGLIFAF